MEWSKVFFRTSLIIITIIYIWSVVWSHLKQRNPESTAERPQNYSSWIIGFQERECKIYSQSGEDGVLLWLFANIGTVNQPPRFVEFGVENGAQCNTRFLRQHLGWQGLMMDGSHENLSINLRREKISVENINDLLEKYQTPSLLDLLSIDIDFDDYFVWKSILKAGRFHARVVIIEFNYDIPTNQNRVVNPYGDSRRWTGSNHFGAGILAMAALGRAYGYTLVYCDQNAVNLFFVQTSILRKLGVLHKVPPIEKLHVSVPITRRKFPPELNTNRSWIWNDTIWI